MNRMSRQHCGGKQILNHHLTQSLKDTFKPPSRGAENPYNMNDGECRDNEADDVTHDDAKTYYGNTYSTNRETSSITRWEMDIRSFQDFLKNLADISKFAYPCKPLNFAYGELQIGYFGVHHQTLNRSVKGYGSAIYDLGLPDANGVSPWLTSQLKNLNVYMKSQDISSNFPSTVQTYSH